MSVPAQAVIPGTVGSGSTAVATARFDYTFNVAQWSLVADACDGEAALKLYADRYLPRPNPTDRSEENVHRYRNYVMRAVYYNASGRTLSALVGIAFNQDPTVKLPALLDVIAQDVTGSGLSLIQFAQKCLAEVLRMGRAGVLVDYPKTDAPVTRLDQATNGIRAVLNFYGARDVINWRTIRQGGKTMLSLLVLRETWEEDADFLCNASDQFRVLRLTDGVYTQELWRKTIAQPGVPAGTAAEWYIHEPPATVLDGTGRPWTEIPFMFIGSRDNDSYVDPSPMYDLCSLNVAHYRNSADFEDSCYLVGQPQFWMSGLDERWIADWEKNGIYVGSRAILPLPQGGSAGVLQASPNGLVRQAMVDKENQMAALGARLLIGSGTVKTATQQDSEDASAHSVLSLCCNNVSSALTKCMQWAAQFEDIAFTKPGDSKDDSADMTFSINTEFTGDSLDAPTLTVLLAMVQAGKLPESDFWQQLRNLEIIKPDKTDDEIREEVESQTPVLPPVNPLFGGGNPPDPSAPPVDPNAPPPVDDAK